MEQKAVKVGREHEEWMSQGEGELHGLLLRHLGPFLGGVLIDSYPLILGQAYEIGIIVLPI